MARDKEFWKGIMCLFGGFCIHLFLGCLYLFGNIQVYITSYLHIYDPSVTLNSTLIIAPTLTLCQGLTVFFGPYLLNYIGPRWIILFGCSVCLGGLLASSYVTSLPAFVILYGVYYGLGLGVVYLVPLV